MSFIPAFLLKNRTLERTNVYCSIITAVFAETSLNVAVLFFYMGKLNSLKDLLRDLRDLTLASFYILFLTSLLLVNTSSFAFKHVYIKRLKRCNGDYNCIQKAFEWCSSESEWKANPTRVYNDICLHYYKKLQIKWTK